MKKIWFYLDHVSTAWPSAKTFDQVLTSRWHHSIKRRAYSSLNPFPKVVYTSWAKLYDTEKLGGFFHYCRLEYFILLKKYKYVTSLVAQWLRICLPMKGTQVQSLVQEDPTCRGAAKPVRHNYWAHAQQLLNPGYSRACVPQLEKACTQQQRPNAAKNK